MVGHVLPEEVAPELYVCSMTWISSGLAGRTIWNATLSGAPFAKDVAVGSAAGRSTALAAHDAAANRGASVWALAIEPGGRVGAEGQACFAALARGAANFGGSQPGTGRRGRLNDSALRMELEVAVVKCDALRALQAQGAHRVAALGWAATTGPAGRADRVASAGPLGIGGEPGGPIGGPRPGAAGDAVRGAGPRRDCRLCGLACWLPDLLFRHAKGA